jgi:hypothetical protein
MNKRQNALLQYFLFFFIPVILFYSCNNEKPFYRNMSHSSVSLQSIEKGSVLSRRYCQSCHLYPDAGLANAASWEKGILPNMGPRLGIFHHDMESYPSSKFDKIMDSNVYPAAPLMSSEEWQNIIDYYIATSPDTLPPQKREHSILKDSLTFSVQKLTKTL